MEPPVVKSRGRPRKRRREDAQNEENVNVNGNGDVDDRMRIQDNNEGGNNDKEDVKNAGNSRKRGRPPKRRAVEIRGEATVGRYVLKEFEGSGVFLGKIVSYDSGLYRVDYEDGDFEDLDSGELREYLIGDERQKFVGDMLERKKKLDENVVQKASMKLKNDAGKGAARKSKNNVENGDIVKSKMDVGKGDDVKMKNDCGKGDAMKLVTEVVKENAAESIDDADKQGLNEAGKDEVLEPSELFDEEGDGSEVDDDVSDSSSDSCEYGLGWVTRSETEIPSTPPPELPPSSGTLGVPEECVSHLFSVYGFLRSYSIRLFLSPFTLDDFVGCLNCTVPSTLLDAIHVALLRALRRHLEAQASDGSELASKCLRCVDWSLLDILTWPVYLVHYLLVMGHLNRKEWKGFYIDVLQKDYCTLSVGMKLMVLQILCDDALDTTEIRAEIDGREESEFGVDSDGIASIPLESGSRKAYSRSAKTSVGKDRENLNLDAGNISFGSNSLTVKGKDQEIKSDSVGDDINGDECRLCGMDGFLLCCDGCPSAYHSRCIGVNKLSIPEGEWFCPECKISKLGPPINTGSALRGAEVFGVDPFAQLFLGTCNHLLVLKVSVKTSLFVRYYNLNDVPKVAMALCSSPHHAASYSGICQAILKYWELPQVWLPSLICSQAAMELEKKGDSVLAPVQNGNQVFDKVEPENCASGVGESALNYVSGSGTEMSIITPGADDVSLAAPIQNVITMPSTIGPISSDTSALMSSKLSEPAEISYLSQQGLADGSSMTGISSFVSANKSSSTGQKNGVCLSGNHYLHPKKVCNEAIGRAVQQRKENCLYMGSVFKPYAYINHYVHGDFAASAASNFASFSSDENRSSEIHASDPRKAMAAKAALQAKAFASAASRFFWPSTEKKLIDIPRERCSWCLNCKAPVISRKACLLNQAALNATRSAMKFCSGLKLVKNVEGGLYSIAAYILYIEESLRGLIIGPFQTASYQKEWRKKVEQASNCIEMKSLLLELEKNLCLNALSSEWIKLVDNWTDECAVPQSACAAGSVQKRGVGRRRKHLSASEVIVDDSNDSLSDLSWRSGKLSKLVFQKGTIPCSVLRKAARQGGSRKIPGIYYTEGPDVPKRSRQSIWRSAVEMSMNASGLALQLRYLDHYIKWSDLLRPDQNLQDGKGPETDAFAFRNARICGKKVVENKVMYAVAFGHQKHLSSRLMKSVIEKEESEDGKEKYWFYETRVPLYLIKEYEENAEKACPPPSKKPEQYTKHQKRQLKASRKRAAFLYLTRMRDQMQMCHCASCHRDVLIGASIMCSTCEGFCHKACTMSSSVVTNDDVEFMTTCKHCSRGKVPIQNISTVESPTSPLVVQGHEFQNSAAAAAAAAGSARSKATSQNYENSVTASKSLKVKINGKASLSVGNLESLSEKKPASSDSSTKGKKRPCHWGLIWKKKPADDDGSEFRAKNILFRGTSHVVDFSPVCQLCQKPYNPHLTYIRCETCQYWHHADAVELEESRIPTLVGYKCCRCRRIKTPVCPYADKNTKKPEVKKIRIKGPKEETALADSVSEAFSEPAESLPSTPMSLMDDDVYIEVDDPLLLSVSKVEEIPEPNDEVHYEWNTPLGPGPQKLPVRRHIKNERDDDGQIWSDYSAVQLPSSAETKNISDTLLEWDVANGGLEDGTAVDYENFNFDDADYEPQTYFSFTELLEADDANQFEGVDMSGDGWENLTFEYPQSGFPENCEMGSFDDHVPATSMNVAIDASCNICLQTAPVPDLACHACGLKIHSQCSPMEEVPQGDIWMCFNCRGWR